MKQNEGLINWGRHKVARYGLGGVATLVDQFDEGAVDGIFLSALGEPQSKIFDELKLLPNLKIIVIDSIENLSLEGIEQLTQLEELSIRESRYCLDFVNTPYLRTLSIHWGEGKLNNAESSNLENLHLWGYKSEKKNLSDIPLFQKLFSIDLIQSDIHNLDGISRFQDLISLELKYLPKLESLEGLSLLSLIAFSAEKCARLKGYEFLANCKNLEKLKIHNCGIINSLKFIDSLERLNSFRFLGTDVQDGDLSPLCRLDDVYFTNKRHFSHKTTDFKQAPPMW